MVDPRTRQSVMACQLHRHQAYELSLSRTTPCHIAVGAPVQLCTVTGVRKLENGARRGHTRRQRSHQTAENEKSHSPELFRDPCSDDPIGDRWRYPHANQRAQSAKRIARAIFVAAMMPTPRVLLAFCTCNSGRAVGEAGHRQGAAASRRGGEVRGESRSEREIWDGIWHNSGAAEAMGFSSELSATCSGVRSGTPSWKQCRGVRRPFERGEALWWRSFSETGEVFGEVCGESLQSAAPRASICGALTSRRRAGSLHPWLAATATVP